MLKVEMMTEDNDWCSERTVMIVTHKGEVIAEESDGGEPEDNSFDRDWNFVPFLIEKAYKLGREDVEQEINDSLEGQGV
jgi:hypothetical protein